MMNYVLTTEWKDGEITAMVFKGKEELVNYVEIFESSLKKIVALIEFDEEKRKLLYPEN